MKRTYRSLLFAAPALSLGLAAGAANAAFVDSVGDSFTIDWLFDPNGGADPGPLTAEATFTVTSFSSNAVGLQISITNTTDLVGGGYDNANILSFGFYASPSIDGALTTAGTIFDGLDQDINFPGGFNSIDICLFAAQNCQGGNINLGLTPGSSDTVEVLLTALDPGALHSGLTLTAFPIKFQTSEGSFEFSGTEGPPENPPSVPEPATLSLLGLGLLGLGLAGRRRRS
jgi:hypothetical protein